jgi:hypothetical protein
MGGARRANSGKETSRKERDHAQELGTDGTINEYGGID